MTTNCNTTEEENIKLCGADIGEIDKQRGIFDPTIPRAISAKLHSAYLEAYLKANPPHD